MRNRFKQWVRRVIMLSFASAGAVVSSAATAHDLPIFDTIGLSNCFGVNSQSLGLDADQADLARSLSNPLRDPFAPFQDKSWNWCFANDFNIENTTPRLPESKQLAPQASEDCFDSCDELDYLNESQDSSQPLHDETNGIPTNYDNAPSDQPASKDSYLAILNASNIKLPSIDLQAALEQFSQTVQSAVKQIASIEPVVIGGEAELAAIDEDANLAEVESISESASFNYLRNRPLVDDYLDGESFVRDWRSLRPLSSPARFDSLNIQSNLLLDHKNSGELPIAIPAHANNVAEFAAVVFSELENLQCMWVQETFHFDATRSFAKSIATFDLGIGNSTDAAFQKLARFWSNSEQQTSHLAEYAACDDFFGQPLFVIQKLDGKEFLLPAKQARHWNTVPLIAKQANVPEKAVDATIESKIAISTVARNLIQSASIGLDRLANQLHGIASSLRLSAEVDAQVANLGDDEDVR